MSEKSKTCPVCYGKGEDIDLDIATTCWRCSGAGKIPLPANEDPDVLRAERDEARREATDLESLVDELQCELQADEQTRRHQLIATRLRRERDEARRELEELRISIPVMSWSNPGALELGTIRPGDTYCPVCDVFGHEQDSPWCVRQQLYDLRESIPMPAGKLTQHWLWAAYERVCAGEDETAVLPDYGYERCRQALLTSDGVQELHDLRDKVAALRSLSRKLENEIDEAHRERDQLREAALSEGRYALGTADAESAVFLPDGSTIQVSELVRQRDRLREALLLAEVELDLHAGFCDDCKERLAVIRAALEEVGVC